MHRFLVGGSVAALLTLAIASSANAQQVQRDGSVYYKAVCPPVSWEMARCEALIITDSQGNPLARAKPPISGLTPSDLRSAYKITATGQSSTIIAIVDAGGYPTDDHGSRAESDMAAYRAQFQLPACTSKSGCFEIFNQNGEQNHYPRINGDWPVEQALDLDMASAMCPNCTIYLIEGNKPSFKDLGQSVNVAAQLGAHVISNSYCGTEARGDKLFAGYYNHPGVAVTAGAGDDGYGMCAPADMPTVIAVGGTNLTTDANKRGWTETVWSGTGSGCSTLFNKPKWQTDSGCSMRTNDDVAADAGTAVAIYYNGSWNEVFGTSVATPLVGGIFADNGGKVDAAHTIYAHTKRLFDVTTGSNGTCSPAYLCTGEVGYDGPTGNGTPDGIRAFGDK
ncbi:MAG TPA: S8 family serine peptidase [Bryobacteraceae bacterium]|jgi:subtilase family serine protease